MLTDMELASRIKGIAVGALGLGGMAVAALTVRIIESTSEQTGDTALGTISRRIERLEQASKPSAKDLELLAHLREIRGDMEQDLRDLASQRPWNAPRLEGGQPSQ